RLCQATARSSAQLTGSRTARSFMCRTNSFARRIQSMAAALVLLGGISAHAQPEPEALPPDRPAPAADALADARAARDIRLAYLFSDGPMPVTLDAFKVLLDEHPELRGRVGLQFLTESTVANVDADDVADADVLIVDMMNQQMLDRFNADNGVDLIGDV